MAKAKLVLGKTEKVADLLGLLKKLKEAGFETVDIESPETIREVVRYVERSRYWWDHTVFPRPLITSTAPDTDGNFFIYCSTPETARGIGWSRDSSGHQIEGNVLKN